MQINEAVLATICLSLSRTSSKQCGLPIV